MQAIANAVILAWGWRRWLIALLAGALAALAQAPINAAPVLFVSLPVLVWLLDGAVAANSGGRIRRLRPAFAAGWWFGFGYFLAGLWWIGSAFLVEADVFAWMLPFAVVLVPAGLALFWGVAAMLARLFWSPGWPRILTLALALTALEWLRGHIFTGFPWNGLGYAFAITDATLQPAALVGAYGLGFAALVLFALPAAFWPRPAERGAATFAVVVLALAVAGGVWGAARLATASDASVPDVRLRLVQPAVPQTMKLDPQSAQDILDHLLALSAMPGTGADAGAPLGGATLVVWPETAVPFYLTESAGALTAIANLLPPGSALVTGAPRLDVVPIDGVRRAFNSLYVIDDLGRVVDAYDKEHLVPFGEYLPFEGLLDRVGLNAVTDLVGGFSAGHGRETLDVPGAPPFSPLICYEVIFPGAVVDRTERPGWIVNITNDAWFGITSGPHQHFTQARVRAVEEGLPVVRAANNGISGIVDAYGRVRASLALGPEGVVDGDLPAAIEPTPYARWGDLAMLPMLGIALILNLAGRLGVARRRAML